MRTKHLVAILILLTLALPASPAHAGGIVSVCDEAHLLAALAGGGIVTFACSGTITLTRTLVIAIDTAIDGGGQDVTISGDRRIQVFSVNSGVALRLNQMTVADGAVEDVYGRGGAIYNQGAVTIRHSTFFGNIAFKGGAIYNDQGGILNVGDGTFISNGAWWHGGSGGGIYNYSATSIISNSTFTNNNAAEGWGGGISNDGYYGAATLVVNNTTFVDNFGMGAGAISNGGILTVTNSTFFDSQSFYGGGGISNDGTLTVSNSSFAGNNAYAGYGVPPAIRALASSAASRALSSGNSRLI